MSFDVAAVRAEFPILSQTVDGKPLVYLDNGATTQKPQVVIDSLVDFYTQCNANVHRGAHQLSDEATRRYEKPVIRWPVLLTRQTVAKSSGPAVPPKV